MRRLLVIFLALTLAAIFWTPAAQAGRVYVWAENAQFDTDSTGCTKTYNQGTNSAYVTVNCTPGDNATFYLGAAFPADASTTWGCRVHYETDDTGASKTCLFDVDAIAMRPGSTVNQSMTWGQCNTGATATHEAGKRYVTVDDNTVSIIDGSDGNPCTGTECQNTDMSIRVRANVSSTASACKFRMVEMSY